MSYGGQEEVNPHLSAWCLNPMTTSCPTHHQPWQCARSQSTHTSLNPPHVSVRQSQLGQRKDIHMDQVFVVKWRLRYRPRTFAESTEIAKEAPRALQSQLSREQDLVWGSPRKSDSIWLSAAHIHLQPQNSVSIRRKAFWSSVRKS